AEFWPRGGGGPAPPGANPQAAAPAPGTAAVGPERVALDADREFGLDRLNRGVEHVAAVLRHAGDAITGRSRTVAAVEDLVLRETPTGMRGHAVQRDRHVAAR